jgi:hypothetical protein
MTVNYSNETGINLPMAIWLLNDTYDHVDKENYISATTLLKPTREIVLGVWNKSEDKAIEISTLIKSRLGHALHDSIEDAWGNTRAIQKACKLVGIPEDVADQIVVNPEGKLKKGQIPVYMELRTIKEIDGFLVGGKFDLAMAGDLHDYKSTGTFSYTSQSNADKYIKQGSIYRWLNPEIITNDIFTINYLFTDWVAWKIDTANYPPHPVMEQHFELLSYEETERFIRTKLADIVMFSEGEEEELPLCTPEELWIDPPVYKYFKNPTAQRATKNFSNMSEAQALMAKNGCGIVKEVHGMAKACNYCSSMPFCSQAENLRKAGQL